MGAGRSSPVVTSEAPPPPKPAATSTCCCLCGCFSCWPTTPIKGMARADQRRCRDLLCCTLFAIFWLGMIAIGILGYIYGNPNRLIYGVDYEGNTCGVGARSSTSYITYPRLQTDFFLNLAQSNPLNYQFYGICTTACPGTLQVVCNYGFASGSNDAMLACLNGTLPAAAACPAIAANCWITPIATSATFYRCVPVYNTTNAAVSKCIYPYNIVSATDPACVLAQTEKSGVTTFPAQTNQLFETMSTARQTVGRWFGDLVRAWWVLLLCAVGVTLALAFLWLLVAKWCTAVFVWGTVTLVVGLLTALTIYFYAKGGLINISLPPSIQDEVNTFSTTISSQVAVLTYYVPQPFQFTMSPDTYKIVAYVFTGITLIIVAIVIALRTAIKTAVKTIELGAEALQSMPSLVFFPLTTVVAIALFLMWWIFVLASLATSGTALQVNGTSTALAAAAALSGMAGVSNATLASFLSAPSVNASFTAIQDIAVLDYMIIYHIFGALWTAAFITGCASMVVAGAVGAWYFSRVPTGSAYTPPRCCGMRGCGSGSGTMSAAALPAGAPRPATLYAVESWPLAASLARVVKYYLGTVALGAFVLALLAFVRALLAYAYRRMRASGGDSAWLRFLCCCAQCCLGCLQKCVELITRNAYIHTAIKGTSFCESGAAVFSLLTANLATVAAVNVLAEIILFLGKVMIATASSWICYAVLDNVAAFQPGGATPLASTWLVIVVNFFFAYVTASAFMLIFDITIDTVLICFLVDRAENGGVAAHMDARKFDELERAAAAEAAAHALGGGRGGKVLTHAEPAALTSPQPSAPPATAVISGVVVPIDPAASFAYAHSGPATGPGRGSAGPAGSAAAYA